MNRIWKNCCCRVVNILLLFILEEEQTGNLDSSLHSNFEGFTRKGVEYEKKVKEESRYSTFIRLEEIHTGFGIITVVEQ